MSRRDDEAGDKNSGSSGKDSTVDDWFGQSVDRDAELADEVTDGGRVVDDDAEREFEERASGQKEQDARHGDRIDPDQGRRGR